MQLLGGRILRKQESAAANGRQPAVFMVGSFPPPVHGAALINQKVREYLGAVGAPPAVIDVSAKNLSRSFWARLGRLPNVMRGLCRFLLSRAPRGGTFYISVSGGLGQMYDLLFVLLARLRGMRVYIHHHSFAYLDRPRVLTRALAAVAGRMAVHVTLSQGMAARLRALYPPVCHTVPVSNTVFLADSPQGAMPRKRSLSTVGFLSNISAEKGIDDFLNVIVTCEAEGLPLKAKIAGPFQDAQTERRVRQCLNYLSSVEYVGPVYGAAKEAFFYDIDALIFPTRYINEAEPVTIHEAMQRYIPVIAYGRGCIPEIVGSDSGLVVDPGVPFVPVAVAKLKEWIHSPESYKSAAEMAGKRFEYILAEAQQSWNNLVRQIVGGKFPK